MVGGPEEKSAAERTHSRIWRTEKSVVSKRQRGGTRALRAALTWLSPILGCSLLAPGLNAAEEVAPAENQSPWDWSATLRSGVGGKDNILLSDFFKESSVFTFNDLEAFVFRIPQNGWEFTGVLTGEDRRYWQSESVDKEQFLLTSAEVKKSFWEHWKAGLGLQYFYNNQVFDASVAEGLPFRVRAKLHRFSTGPSLELDLENKRRLELSFSTIRQDFAKPLDDSWEFGPRLMFAQKFGPADSEFTTTLQWRHRTYDTRAPVGADAKSLTFDIPELEFGIKYYWDEEKHWKSKGRAGVELNEDNGSGFFDYRRWKLSHELDWTHRHFEGILQARFLHYEYTHQFAPDNHARRRTELLFGGRARQEIITHLNIFAEVEHEWVLATDFEERYHATTIWGGIEWEVK